MPEGLDTEITAGGGGLSAGEAQLLAFTRVFLRDPGLVVLDEPSSRLDLATERLLERAMRRLMKDRTTIIIAHRLSTVRRADRIMILEAGRIIEEGPRHELARDRTSRFHRLLSAGGAGLHDGAVAAAALITLDDDGLPDIDLDEVEARNGH
jgi:ATP-binding cassette subfamily B protein